MGIDQSGHQKSQASQVGMPRLMAWLNILSPIPGLHTREVTGIH